MQVTVAGVGADAGVETVRSHLAAMLRQVERPEVGALSAELPMGCVDGRKPACVIGAPGGNAGLLLLLLASVEEVRGEPFTPDEVAEALLAWLDAFGSFYLHSDTESMERLGAALGTSDPVGIVRSPPASRREEVVEALLRPEFTGCGHLRLALEHPERYGLRPGLAAELLRSVFHRLHEGDPRIDFEVLEGVHAEEGVLRVRLEEEGRLAATCPHHGDHEYFVYHPGAVAWLTREAAAFAAARGWVRGDQLPTLARTQEALAARHLEATLLALAPGLPVYDVAYTADGVTVASAGQVPGGG